jgi:hypothetical protein
MKNGIDTFKKRCLASAIRAKDRQDFSSFDLESDIPKDRKAIISEG